MSCAMNTQSHRSALLAATGASECPSFAGTFFPAPQLHVTETERVELPHCLAMSLAPSNPTAGIAGSGCTSVAVLSSLGGDPADNAVVGAHARKPYEPTGGLE
jgi:hypothetical protein